MMISKKLKSLFSTFKLKLGRKVLNWLFHSFYPEMTVTERKELQSLMLPQDLNSIEIKSALGLLNDLEDYTMFELSTLLTDVLSKTEKDILDFIEQEGGIDPIQLSQHLNLKKESIFSILEKLSLEGSIFVNVVK